MIDVWAASSCNWHPLCHCGAMRVTSIHSKFKHPQAISEKRLLCAVCGVLCCLQLSAFLSACCLHACVWLSACLSAAVCGSVCFAVCNCQLCCLRLLSAAARQLSAAVRLPTFCHCLRCPPALCRCPRDPPSHCSGMVGEWWAAGNFCAHVPPAAPHDSTSILTVRHFGQEHINS